MPVDLDKLTEPFPRTAIKQRAAGGGRMLDYVEGHTVIHRLNDATNNCWDMTVRSIESRQLGENTLMIAHVQLTIQHLGTREGLGVQMVHARGGEDLVKGCITDGLKKAATLFGVGLELYGADYAEGESAPQPQRQVSQPQQSQHNWQDFWTWARSQNLGSPQAIEGLINQPISGMSPTQIRDAIQHAQKQQRPVQAPQNGNGQPRQYENPPVNTGDGATLRQLRYLQAVSREAGMDAQILDALSQREFGAPAMALSKRDCSALIDLIQNQQVEIPLAQGSFHGMPESTEPDEEDYDRFTR